MNLAPTETDIILQESYKVSDFKESEFRKKKQDFNSVLFRTLQTIESIL